VLVYAIFGTSRQLAVGPVAIVSLLTATALAPIAEEGTAEYLAAAALLALMVGAVHLVLGFGRLGFLVNFLSHAVLVGFTAAAALIIGASQVKHLFGVSIPKSEHFYETVRDTASTLADTNGTTLAIAVASVALLVALKRFAPQLPAAMVVVVGSILAVELFDLESRGVKVVGSIPDSLPGLSLPSIEGSLIGDLAGTAVIITLVGFMESMAVAKVYARRHRYELDPDQELIGLGAANVASGLVGGYPVTGGFSRTAVNDTAGARTPLASIFTAVIVVATIAFLTPLFSSLPQAALGAIIIMAVVGLVDVTEMRHIAAVKRSDVISMAVAFFATLVLGIELGIAGAVVVSMLVVFARMSSPHTAVLGRVSGTTTYRNTARFADVAVTDGIRIVRIDAAVSFVNSTNVKRLLLDQVATLDDAPRALVLDASGINDLDATGADMLSDVLTTFDERGVQLHLAETKGPVRDVLRASGLWQRLGDRVHAGVHEAVEAIAAGQSGPVDQRVAGIDETTADPDAGAGIEAPEDQRHHVLPLSN